MKIALLIIAAGRSARLGQPKQLLSFKNTFLLDYIINECQTSEVGDIFVVLGANRELIEPKLNHSTLKDIFYNSNWADGMGTSIACGISNIKDKNYDGVIVLLADQPFFTSNLLIQIIEHQINTLAKIIVSKYRKGMGPPTFFDKSLFEKLSKLKDDIGAKPIIKQYFNEIETVDFEKGNLDIDTVHDLKWLV
jgi:molybdenum cofactor cytidylyltransferase